MARFAVVCVLPLGDFMKSKRDSQTMVTLASAGFSLTVECIDGVPVVSLADRATGFELAEGAYRYAVTVSDTGTDRVTHRGLTDAAIEQTTGRDLTITGTLGPFAITHRLSLDRGYEETISVENASDGVVTYNDVACGLNRSLASGVGGLVAELAADRLVAIPFRRWAGSPLDGVNEFSMADIVRGGGTETRVGPREVDGQVGPREVGVVPTNRWESDAWAWEREGRTYVVAKFNDAFVEKSVFEPELGTDGMSLRFGGATTTGGGDLVDRALEPGESRTFGSTRIRAVDGDYHAGYYAYRELLDERGCHFPEDYDPPVHWNELYDNPEWHVNPPDNDRQIRSVTYTRERIEEEARKARDYHCDALYLDPGWDTAFGSLLWGEEWLGNRREFVDDMREDYGLDVSLHCPTATWATAAGNADAWPDDAVRIDETGAPFTPTIGDGTVLDRTLCMASDQYVEEAADRLIDHCDDGVDFLMFDGTAWFGPCWNENHGHGVPSTKEDHCRGLLELAQRIHEEHPDVLIELHDPVASIDRPRVTPIYYKFAEPGSHDENWGFELMWNSFEDILSGDARSLYYYNLASNIPLYLHISLHDDNEHCLAFWWYASTCRHLGIGGTHRTPAVAEAQQRAMARYQDLKAYYSRGEFYGTTDCREEVHFHVLPEDESFVVNLFNLEDEERVLEGSISLEQLGLAETNKLLVSTAPHLTVRGDEVHWSRRLPARGTDVFHTESIAVA